MTPRVQAFYEAITAICSRCRDGDVPTACLRPEWRRRIPYTHNPSSIRYGMCKAAPIWKLLRKDTALELVNGTATKTIDIIRKMIQGEFIEGWKDKLSP